MRRCCGRCRTEMPRQLVTIWETSGTTPRGFASPPNMLDWKARSRTFETIAGYTPSMGSMVMSGRDGNALTVSRQWVTSGIFDVLGVKPIAGRTFTSEDEAERRRSVVISEGLWETRFDRDPSIVGGQLKLDGELVDCRRRDATELRDPRPDLDVGDASVSTQHAAARAGRLPVAGRWPDEARCRRCSGAGRSGDSG